MTAPRQRRAWPAPLALLALAALASVAILWLRPARSFQAEYLVFGSHASVQLRSTEAARAEDALDRIGQLLREDHRDWHAWEPGALTELNAALAAGHAQRPPDTLLALIREARRGHALSGGLFNPAAGRTFAAWGFHTSDYPVRTAAPDARAIGRLQQAHASMDDIVIADDGMVSSRNPAVALDLNALSEGFAAGQIRDLLRDARIDDALIDVGGFVLALGDDGGTPWAVGVRGGEGLLATLQLRDGEGLASSGDYQRRRAGGSTANGHIIDPRAGRPQRASVAASVLGRDPVLVDMAATALMVAGPDRMDRVANDMGVACVALQAHDGTLHLSQAMQARLALRPDPQRKVRIHALGDGPC
ncbi:FAD:protein FMN transferase [Xanthomonas sp. XNM01]|uniref:FAD:protein FMN transferase n=1 Tax=Xanthomonas sp. XNM01 TaxID=2769289 RepID=UPI00178605D1|nr:FAD:protein FMN transferase [Xanthomonas sp. XNM01]